MVDVKKRVLLDPVDVKLNRRTLIRLKQLKHVLRKGTIEEVVNALIDHYERITGVKITAPEG